MSGKGLTGDPILEFALDTAMAGAKYDPFHGMSGYTTGAKRQRTYATGPTRRRRRKKIGVTGGVYTGKLVPDCKWGKAKAMKPKLRMLKEFSGTTTDPEVVFIGMGVNYEDLLKNVTKLIVHAIFSMCGYNITNYDLGLNFEGNLAVIYYNSPTAVSISSFNVAITNNQTVNDIANTMWTALNTNFGGGNGAHKLKTFRLLSTRNAVDQLMGQFSASNLKIPMQVYQTVLVQNQTKGAIEASDNQTTNVAANPLHIGVFDANGNIVYEKDRSNDIPTGWKPWITYNDSYPELYLRDTANWVVGQRPNQVASIFSNAKQKYRAILQPGEMKKIKLVHRFSGNVNYWYSKFYRIVADDVSSLPVPLPGKQRIIAFDKMLDDGATPVLVGYEMNQQTSGSWKYKKPKNIVPVFQSGTAG